MILSKNKKVEIYLEIYSNVRNLISYHTEWLPKEKNPQILQNHIDDLEATLRVLDRYKTGLLYTQQEKEKNI